MEKSSRRLLSLLCVLALAATFVSPLIQSIGAERAHDRNNDGLPDLWQVYDAHGLLVESSADTNFDGRWDIRERYVAGALVRRDYDRNFDDRIDLVEYFTADQEHSRSILDVGFDGRADLLVLFADGRPISSHWAGSIDAPADSARSNDDSAFTDPFAGQAALRSVSCRSLPWSVDGTFPTVAALNEPTTASVPITELIAHNNLRDATPQSGATFTELLRGPPSTLL